LIEAVISSPHNRIINRKEEIPVSNEGVQVIVCVFVFGLIIRHSSNAVGAPRVLYVDRIGEAPSAVPEPNFTSSIFGQVVSHRIHSNSVRVCIPIPKSCCHTCAQMIQVH